ncbi:MAG: AsmA family protein [Deltaproteobacteria bacterium]|nr:AsmA family protein [Deltaproteobacteria bacterium]
MSLDPMTAKAYEGTVEAKASLDVRQDLPAYTVSKSVTGFQVGPYLKDFIGKDPIEGTASMKADFAGRGLTEEEILKNLAGVFSFRFENGAVNGINVPKMLRDAVGLFRGQRPVPDEDLKTDFALLSGSVHVADALAVNKDLKMEAPLLRVSGAGRVNLLTKAVDYGTQVAVVATLKGQEGEPLSELAGLTVPLKITGTYDKPEFGLDVASVLKDKAVQEGLDRLKKEVEISKDVEEKIPEEVKEKLPGVLDRFIKK